MRPAAANRRRAIRSGSNGSVRPSGPRTPSGNTPRSTGFPRSPFLDSCSPCPNNHPGEPGVALEIVPVWAGFWGSGSPALRFNVGLIRLSHKIRSAGRLSPLDSAPALALSWSHHRVCLFDPPLPDRGRMFLLQRLQEKGHLSDADARRATEAQAAEPSRPLHEILLEKGIGNELH